MEEKTKGRFVTVNHSWLWVPQNLMAGLLLRLHENHPGVVVMIITARSMWFWCGMMEDICKLVAGCMMLVA